MESAEKKPFFSIVIPVYQAEKHLEECVRSVLAQSFQDWELILVNDGSRDGSREICAAFAAEDSRIHLVNQENAGAAQARNHGTELAHGEYLMYLDSDDYWEDPQALEKVHSAAAGNDICLFGCIDEYAGTGERKQSRGNYNQEVFRTGCKEKILESLISTNEFPGSCWILSVRAEMLEGAGVRFISGHRAEDIDWIMKVLCAAQTFTAVNEPFYIYRKAQTDSVTGTAGLKSIHDILETVSTWTSRLKEEAPDCRPLNSYLVYIFFTTMVIYNSLSREDKRKADACYRKTQVDFSAVLGRRQQLLSLFYRMFGQKMTCFALSLIR